MKLQSVMHGAFSVGGVLAAVFDAWVLGMFGFGGLCGFLVAGN